MWKNLTGAGFSKYDVSTLGEIRNTQSKRVISTHVNNRGIVCAYLVPDSASRIQQNVMVVYLVAGAYCNPPSDPMATSVMHLDGDKTNLRPDNLAWRPRWFTVLYHRQFQFEAYRIDRKVKLVETGELYSSIRDAAIQYGLLENDIMQSISGRLYNIYPFGFNFVLEEG